VEALPHRVELRPDAGDERLGEDLLVEVAGVEIEERRPARVKAQGGRNESQLFVDIARPLKRQTVSRPPLPYSSQW
jgi:hypothetical protein